MHFNAAVLSRQLSDEDLMDELLQYQKNVMNTYRMELRELQEFHQTTINYDSTKIWNDEDFDILMEIVRAYQTAITINDYTAIQKQCRHILTHFVFTRPAHVYTCVKMLRLAQWRTEQLSGVENSK
jgi:hypothetical protein